MRCTICKKESDEVELFSGILNAEMVNICETCAESESVPIIKKPSEQQLEKAEERQSVRERMERMSGMREATEISPEQTIVQGNLAKLRIPEKKQHHPDVLDNYYWTLNIARRRSKMTINQIAEKAQINSILIREIEKGKLPENFQEIFLKLESILGIKLLKNHENKINFVRTHDEEQDILENVRAKMNGTSLTEEEEFPQEIDEETKEAKAELINKRKKEKLEKLSKGEADFSKRTDLENVTLNDLVEMKRQREEKESQRKTRTQEESMLGEDIDLELEEI